MQVCYVSKIECLIGFLCSEFIFEKERDCSYESLFFQLLDFIFRDATLSHVTQSVTRNGKSIMLTMMLALILIYLFSLVGFVFFRDDFLANVQRNKYSIRYRRSMKTMTMTRMSIFVVVIVLVIVLFHINQSSSFFPI